MKVVINTCYGGFSLSNFAYKELLKRKGKECYFYEWKLNKGYFRIDGNPDKHYIVIVSTKDYGEFTEKIEQEHRIYYGGGDIRTDPDFIAMIEGFGAKKCGGKFSQLKIVEIPDDIDWEISDYNGIETIHVVHRKWN